MTSEAEDIIDWNAVRSVTGGDDQLLGEIVGMYPEESARHMVAIRAALEEADAEGLERSAHTLKSAARMFGARDLVARAEEMEALGRASSLEEARELLPRLESEAARMLEALERGRSKGAMGRDPS